DSYNLDRIAQMLATNCFQFQDYFQHIWGKVCQTRNRLITSLQNLDFLVYESDANFVLASPQWIEASELYSQLKKRKILVRYFQHPRINNYVRISIGTDAEIDRLLEVIQILKNER
ncbi:MAG: aminotransferase class I/II-fold pyridoxal phosphate-dependent enzyme, partial [Cyanobacteria bacterium P01_G01_bin.49]